MFSFFFALHNTHLNDDVTRAMSLYQLVSYYPSFFLGRKKRKELWYTMATFHKFCPKITVSILTLAATISLQF